VAAAGLDRHGHRRGRCGPALLLAGAAARAAAHAVNAFAACLSDRRPRVHSWPVAAGPAVPCGTRVLPPGPAPGGAPADMGSKPPVRSPTVRNAARPHARASPVPRLPRHSTLMRAARRGAPPAPCRPACCALTGPPGSERRCRRPAGSGSYTISGRARGCATLLTADGAPTRASSSRGPTRRGRQWCAPAGGPAAAARYKDGASYCVRFSEGACLL